MALVTSRAHTQESHRAVTNSERVLNWPPSPGEATDPGVQSFCERDLLAYLNSYGLRGRLLIKNTSKGQL